MEAVTMMTFLATNWTLYPSHSSQYTTANPNLFNYNTTFDYNNSNFTTTRTPTKPRPRRLSKCEVVRRICAMMNPPPPPSQIIVTNLTTNYSQRSIKTMPHWTTTKFVGTTTTTFANSTNFTTPRPPPRQPSLPFTPEKACFLYKVNCLPRPHVDRLCVTMGVIGLMAFLLNIFVIIRILLNNLSRTHQSKIYFFSMAFADLYFGACCALFTLIYYKIIPRPKNQADDKRFETWWVTSHSLSLYSSLFHVVVITGDRLMATTFPLFHKVHVNRKKVMATVIFLWLLALILALIPELSGSAIFPVWFSCLVGITTCVLLIVTYAHISHVAIQRRKTLKTMRRTKQNNPQESTGKKSINTTFLSIAITTAFILCNLFGIVHAFCYLFAREFFESLDYFRELSFIENVLLNVNAAVNPMLYSIVELMNKKAKRSKTSQSYNTTTTTVRRRKTTVTQPQKIVLHNSDDCNQRGSGAVPIGTVTNGDVNNGSCVNGGISTVGSVHTGMLQSSGLVLGVQQENKESALIKSNNDSNGVANEAFDHEPKVAPAIEHVDATDK